MFLRRPNSSSEIKIPIDGGPKVRCQLSVQSSEVELISASKIIIWDDAPLADKSVIQPLDYLLQQLCENELLFGGKLVVLGDDFRQVLPVVLRGSRKEQIESSIVSLTMWDDITKLQLNVNMRARDDPTFIDYLMRIGNGSEPTNSKEEVQIPRPMVILYTSIEKSLERLITSVYPDLPLLERTPFEMMKRSILCPKNEFVDDINSKIIERFSGCEMTYISDDRSKNAKDPGDYMDYLNTLELKELPQHKLVFKKNSQMILLRNTNPVEGYAMALDSYAKTCC